MNLQGVVQVIFKLDTDGVFKDEDVILVDGEGGPLIGRPVCGEAGSSSSEVPNRVIRVITIPKAAEEQDVVSGKEHFGMVRPHLREVGCLPVAHGLRVDQELPLLVRAGWEQSGEAGGQMVKSG